MATVNQIYELVNAVMSDIWGTSESPTVKDVTGLISVGQTIANDGTWTADADKFLNSLVDRIGKTVIRTLDRRVDLTMSLVQFFRKSTYSHLTPYRIIHLILARMVTQPIISTSTNRT